MDLDFNTYCYIVIKSFILIICILLCVAFFTLFERQLMGHLQRRKGPQIVGINGILQPIADGLKLFSKETILPYKINKVLFQITPLLCLFFSLILWVIIPFYYNNYIVNLKFSILYILAISSLNIYTIVFAGWASNSNYSFLGSIRSTAQMISYEICLSFLLITASLTVQSYNFIDFIQYSNLFFIYPIAILLFIVLLAETNRHPFDLPEAESELVSGYNTEYSSIVFALFFLGEYSNILLSSTILNIIFLKYHNFFFFFLKSIAISSIFIIIRSILPRYRFDQLMLLSWKLILPLSLALFIIYFILNKFYINLDVNFQSLYNYDISSIIYFKKF